ncbi:zinc-binding metallopeptidase family protein [Anditalea andensis]|uniref:Zinc-ribbon domain-containing protein n=1 Tax=Anditalea andensis TaxID=1048983 RepID=A0A074KZE1_9BACT|nr:putative zinc-binding metallopeptidase [Anditalea andensis]KEO72988.1 hypothetical protein EL17_15350 [Anditalea andensis]
MQLFKCDHCDQPVYFDNTFCSYCQNLLGFDGISLSMISLHKNNDGTMTAAGSGINYHYCINHKHDVCNWIIPDSDPATICIACAPNRTVPNTSIPEHLDRWKTIEQAKHRLMYALLKWSLPVKSKILDPDNGLAFDFKSDEYLPEGQRVMTGHASGLITMNIAEADDVEREMAKKNMDEVYRTVLGHFRHEIGHYYWDLLISGSEFLGEFRELYGDEGYSYQEALDRYYNNGAPEDWREHYISAYATMHPWESWAETWAHYMHITDTLETAYSYGLTIAPTVAPVNAGLAAQIDVNAYNCDDFDKIYEKWLPLSIMMNSLNRSMGAQDLYPFIINPSVKEKLRFIHKVIHSQKNKH